VTRVLVRCAAGAAVLVAAVAFVPIARAQRQGAPAGAPRRSQVPAPTASARRVRPVGAAEARRTVDSLLANYAKPGAPGASVVVVRDGRVLLERAYGLADVDSNVRATPRTDYRLASLTKQFTAMAVMILAERGTLSYDDSVSRYLPELPAYARGVTIRNLLHHTGGLWDYEDFVPDSQTYQVKDRDVLQLVLRADSLYFRPGSAFRYSNTGYALLALVVERASGRPFARFLGDRIFRPAGMSGTVAYEMGISTVPHRAYGFSRDSSGWRRTDQSNTSATLGDGGIYTSVDDLAKWCRALLGHRLVSAATQQLAWSSATTANGESAGYGFGWRVDHDAHGLRIWHHGETRGFTNGVVLYPDRRLIVAVLTNRLGGTPWDIAQRIAEIFLQ
jgi:CubicO group peptidase (beta-lactamase class C family)